MRLPELCVLLLLGTGQGQAVSNFTETLATRNPELQDTIFTESLLFQRETGSVLSCAMKCRLAHCASFTFTLSSSPSSETSSSSNGSCQGHSTVMTADDASVAAPSSVLFVLEWLGKACADNTQCLARNSECYSGTCLCSPGYYYSITSFSCVEMWLHKACTDNIQCLARNSECFAGTCLCTPGYYYSNTSLSCLDNCPSEDLQSTFVVYPDSAISGYNMASIVGVGLSECLERCSADPLCLTFDLVRGSDCYPQSVTARDVPSWTWYNDTDVVHYQKTCL